MRQLIFAGLIFSIQMAKTAAVTLAWDPNPETDIAGYKLYYGETNSTPTAKSVGNTTQTEVTNLVVGRTYSFYVTALNNAGLESDPSNTILYTEPQQAQPPAAPSNLAGVADSPNQVTLQWTDNSSDESGFRLLRKVGASGAYTTNTLAANAASFTDTGLSASTQYFYKIQSFNAAGSSAFSTEISVTTPANPPPLSGGARFLSADWNTGGSWKPYYGRDGYAVIADNQVNPAYAAASPSGQSQWIWNWTTDDSAALERAGSASRLAACWYAADSFQVALPLSGQGPYRLSVYCLDWDVLNRAEQLDILDAATGQVLNRQSISNFFDGVYVTWEITKPVVLKVTRLAGPNAVISGIFFDSAGLVSSPEFSPAGGTFSNSVSVAISTTTAGATIRYTTDGSVPTASSPVYSSPLTLTNTTTLSARAFKSGLADSTATTATFTLAGNAAGRVRFVGADVTRGGTWKGSLGLDGQMIAYETPGLPAYASVSLLGADTWIWSFPATSVAALERPYQSGRIATTWYAPEFTARISLKDSALHRLSLYFLDFDNNGREETIDLVDPATGAVLDSVLLSSFSNGIWLNYEITGSVDVRVTNEAGANAIMSGIFFDQP